MDIQYRLKILNDAGSAALTPASGAPHSDPFQVTTKFGLSEWMPYLQFPTGARGKLEWKTRQTEHGDMTFEIIDPKVSEDGSDLSRWMSAFFGDVNGRIQPLANLVQVQESIDGGTWTDWLTGRVNKIQKVDDVSFNLIVKDLLGDYDVEVFGTRPHVSVDYAVEPLVLPLGVSGDFGGVKAPPPLTGDVWTNSRGTRMIELSVHSWRRSDNIVTRALTKRTGVPYSKTPSGFQVPVQPGLRVRFSTASVTEKEVELVGLDITSTSAGPQAAVLYVEEVDPDDYFYTEFDGTSVPNGTDISFVIRGSDRSRETGNTTPLLIADVDPIEFWSDLQDGKFCRLDKDGSIRKSFAKDSTIFGTGAGTFRGKFAKVRFVIDQPEKLEDFIPKLCQLIEGGYRLGGSGEMIPLDLRHPQGSLSVPTITNADLVTDFTCSWESGQDDAVTAMEGTVYLDDPITPGDLHIEAGVIPDLPVTLLNTIPLTPFRFEDGEGYDKYGEKILRIDATGFRLTPGETLGGGDRLRYYQNKLTSIALGYFRSLAGGPQYTRIRGFKSASSLITLQIGDIRILDIDELPDPQTNLRGGNRVARCLERTEDGPEAEFYFMDLGPNTIAAQPTVGTPTKETGNTKNGIDDSITLNAASDKVELQIALTDTSASQPDADLSIWRTVTPTGQSSALITASGSVNVRGLPAGMRVWPRTRSLSSGKNPKLSSAWTHPSGTKYVDLDGLTAPTSAVATSISTRALTLGWSNNGDDESHILIRLGKGTSQSAANADAGSDLIILPPNSTIFTITGLDQYGAGVVWFHPKVFHIDGLGGISSAAELSPNVSIEATGTAPTAPSLGGIAVFRGAATTGPPLVGTNVAQPAGYPGIELGFYLGPSGQGYGIEIARGTSSGSHTSYATIPPERVSGQVVTFMDHTEASTTIYYYVARLIGAGADPGPWSSEVSSAPGWIFPFVWSTPGEAVFGKVIPEKIGPSDWRPQDPTFTGYTVDATLLLTATGATKVFQYHVRNKNGAKLVGLRLVAYKHSSSDLAQLDLYLPSFPGGLGTALETLTAGDPLVGGSFVDNSITFDRDLTGDSYILTLSLSATSSGYAQFAYAELKYEYSQAVQR